MADKDKYNETDNWEKEAPLLASLEKKNPFSIPEGYFESLDQRIMDRVKGSDISPVPGPVGSGSWNIFRAELVAVFLLLSLLGISAWLMNEQPVSGDAYLFAGLSNEELMLELEESDLDEEVIIAMMGEEALAGFTETQQISDESLEEYLQDEIFWEDINVDDIINENF